MPVSFQQLAFASSDARVNDSVWVMGYGQQTPVRPSTNTVPGTITSIDDAGRQIMTNADMLSGHSGGPVVNRTGAVVGWSFESPLERVTSGDVIIGWSGAGGIHAVRPIRYASEELAAVLDDL